jgi:hypothetical protein
MSIGQGRAPISPLRPQADAAKVAVNGGAGILAGSKSEEAS